MTREQLEHAIRAACDVAKETEVYVFGSQAILGQYPDAPEALRMSAEAAALNRTSAGVWKVTTSRRASSWHSATRTENS